MLVAWIAASLLSLALTTLLAAIFRLDGPEPLVASTTMALCALVLAFGGDAGRVVAGTPICAAIIAFAAGFPSTIPLWLVLMLAASLPFPPILGARIFARR